MTQIGRNEPCLCGSGKKYKHCCGNLSVPTGKAAGRTDGAGSTHLNLVTVRKEALRLLAQREFLQAAELYRRILLHAPNDFDALHMLGVTQGIMGKPGEALRLMLEAASVATEDCPPLFDNLGRTFLVAAGESDDVAKIICPDLAGVDLPLRVSVRDLPALPDQLPFVSIVIPCCNHESYVVEAIRSVYAQTYPNMEIIIIDDGSRDRSVEKIKEVLGESRYPVKLVVRENRGAHATLNEGIELASGAYIGILNSDDLYFPQRVDSLVRLLVSTGREWGFSGVKFIDANSEYLQYGQDEYADTLMQSLDRLYSDTPITIGFASFNYAVTTGNLFFSKTCWKRIGGFSDYRYVHDWDFCLHALERESPAVLHEPTYAYRLHGENTIKEDMERAKSEAMQTLLAWGQGDTQSHQPTGLRDRLIACARDCAFLTTDRGHLIDRQRLIELAQGFVARGVAEAI